MCLCGGASEHGHGYPADTVVVKSLHDSIEHGQLSCLNAQPGVDLSSIIRASNVETCDRPLLSDDPDDPRLLLKIPFTGTVKLRSISVTTPNITRMQVWINQPALNFASLDNPVQIWHTLSSDGCIDYPCRAAKFLNVNHLTILLSAEQAPASLSFLGLRGEFSHAKVGVIRAEYELKPQLADHKNPTEVFTTINRSGF